MLQLFADVDTDDDDGIGISINFVVDELQGQGVSEADVRNAIDFLADEGYLYRTIDDEHFKKTV